MKVKSVFFSLAFVIVLFVAITLLFRNSDLIGFTDDFTILTDEVAEKLRDDDSAELDSAQKILDERKDDLSQRLSKLTKEIVSESKDGEFLRENLEKNSSKFEAAFTGKIKNDPTIKKNPEVKKKLEELLRDYSAIVNGNF